MGVKKPLFFICLLFFLSLIAKGAKTDTLSEKLWDELRHAGTAKDSIKALYNLFDVTYRDVQTAYGEQLLKLAVRTNNHPVQIDMMMQLAGNYANTLNDSAIQELIKLAGKLPESNEKKECIVMLHLQSVRVQAKQSSQESKNASEHIHNFELEESNDLFTKILQLNTLCIHLEYVNIGNLYLEYSDKLGALIGKLPPQLYALRSHYYTHSAIVHTANSNYKKAIKADMELLNIIKELEKRYSEMGRIYRNYDINRYIIYRRLLTNYPGLTRQEIEDCYKACVDITKRNEDAKSDFQNVPRVQAYYYFATQQYKTAIPYIRKCLAQGNMLPSMRRQYLQMLRDAASVTGNNALLLEALTEYNVLLEDHIEKKSDEFFRDLQIRYDVDALKEQNTQLELQKQQSELKSHQRIINIAIPALIISLILTAVIWFLYLRSRKLTTMLQSSNSALAHERDLLNQTQTELVVAFKRAEEANHAKSEFLHSMSHEVRTPLNSILGFSQLIVKKIPDTIPEESRAQLDKYANLVKVNTDYLATLINNILDISFIESNEMAFNIQNVSVRTLCENAVDEIKPHVKKGVQLRFDSSNPDFEIATDGAHVEQVLVNLLSNAAKFTKQGSITLGYHFKGLNKLVFEVSDTGIGVPAGKEQAIFERFVKLDSFSQGSGLGLYLCQQIAVGLGGELYVDKSYLNGARFCFTIPVNPKK